MAGVGFLFCLAATPGLEILPPMIVLPIAWLLCFVGHVGLWCVAFNRIHATALPRRFRKQTEKIIIPIVALPILYVIAKFVFWFQFDFGSAYLLVWIYMLACVGLGLFFAGRWFVRKYIVGRPAAVVSYQRTWIDMRPRVSSPFFHGTMPEMLGAIPMNEASKLTLEKITFSLPMPKALDGLKICQLSDLHFTGHISVEYFEAIVDEANQFQPDLIVITGDFIDEQKCWPWFDSTIAKLRAKYGVYAVLGNHDKRIPDEQMLRKRLEECGLTLVAGKWQMLEINGATVSLTGNELPWFDAVQSLPPPAEQPPADLSILLSHSPDQIDWAQDYKFNLMFAGHTHGGQIAFPIVGPIVAPSRYGVKYASGTFQVGDILMHVSRGISGDEPIRVNSPPELGLFILKSKA
jgi:predicted MPP superfamily phosphohydrolase